VRSSISTFDFDTPTPLFQTRIITIPLKAQYAVSRDGRFRINQSPVTDAVTTPITLILNWKPKDLK